MKKICALVVLVIAMVFMLEGIAFAMEYSADVVSTSGKTIFTGKMWFSNDRMRLELVPSDNNNKNVPTITTITRLDKLVVWVLMVKDHKYLEQNFAGLMPVGDATGDVQKQLLGSETIDGRTADKFRVIGTYKGKTYTTYQWLDADSGIPLKFTDEKGQYIQEYKNIVQGPQDGGLFEIPAGYQKFSLPLGNLFGL
ncbi:MAG: hypothetical protein P4N59_10500 [Negativicutes bacterium]|nr:hypothetical protein [Negativicutes bacterium]